MDLERRLIVVAAEDEKITREIVAKMAEKIMEKLGRKCKILEVGDGQEALKLLGNNFVDALISDIEMPKLDGNGLFHELENRHYYLPIIFISGREENLEKVELLANKLAWPKPVFYLAKPFKLASLEGPLKVIKEDIEAHMP